MISSLNASTANSTQILLSRSRIEKLLGRKVSPYIFQSAQVRVLKNCVRYVPDAVVRIARSAKADTRMLEDYVASTSQILASPSARDGNGWETLENLAERLDVSGPSLRAAILTGNVPVANKFTYSRGGKQANRYRFVWSDVLAQAVNRKGVANKARNPKGNNGQEHVRSELKDAKNLIIELSSTLRQLRGEHNLLRAEFNSVKTQLAPLGISTQTAPTTA